jgi:hypothetical protein
MPQRFAKGFDPAVVKAMMDAFDQACDRLGIERTHDEETVRLATAIVAAAESGERDPNKLCAIALRSLARDSFQSETVPGNPSN